MAENDIDTIDVLMDSIDAGEKRIQQVDWTDFCITCVQIYAQANGDIDKIREAYSLAQNRTSTIKNLTAWMISAIKNGWKDSYVSQKKLRSGAAFTEKSKGFLEEEP